MKPLHWSQLRNLAESPAHYKYYVERSIRPTPAMMFGSLVDRLLWPGVLSPYGDRFVTFLGPRRGARWKDFKSAHEGATIVTMDEYQRGMDCVDALRSDPVCGPLLATGSVQETLRWQIGGRECVGTPDLVDDGEVLLDLKITAYVNPDRFHWHARKMQWTTQLAWYRSALLALGRPAPKRAVIVAVSQRPPFVPVAYTLSPELLEVGERTWRLLLSRLHGCEESDQWPGYAQCLVPLDVMDEGDFALVIDGEEVAL